MLPAQYGPLIQISLAPLEASMFAPPVVSRQSSVVVVLCLFAVSFLTSMSYAQNVTTWHNDNNRTGWQSSETTLTTSNVNQTGSFGLLQKWPVTGYVFAQPLTVANVTTTNSNSTCHPCDLVLVVTEQDMLYAFNASTNSSTPV